MKCPRCGSNKAYLYAEDGITQPGEQEVEIKCLDCGKDDYDVVGCITIKVSTKRGSLELFEEEEE